MVGRQGGHNKGGGRKNENNKIYAHPLPILFSEPPQTSLSHKLNAFLGINDTKVLNPHCHGVLDVATRSVWVTDPKDVRILWTRGFFGKGDLSRSEPSWHARQVNAMKAAAGNYLTSEEIREKRRNERKQFKLDRARALAEAAAEAEAAFVEGREAVLPEIPSGATWKPSAQSAAPEPGDDAPPSADADEVELLEEELLEDVEHMQLTLQEAFFLCWGLDCLTILDPHTSQSLSLQQIWVSLQQAFGIIPSLKPVYTISPEEERFDNPFLVNYAVYHHYRSLGWVVKSGIKFCVDLLLYKRGPVFHHAEFGVLVIPVYEDPADKLSSPYALANADPMSWTWLSTINRVNSQVQKTLVLAYVTIPSSSHVPHHTLSSPACLNHYSVREVVLRRFIPARMRD
ncbi:tRNA splicing endonuclease subunit sen2 [Steccherinum ochraceum]|uniref:tRNA-splicing endonuclease subunit Sen2 n=1 Tax=Steccherinum ochraceum TaxID=92696 RepID=A0A4R0RGL0_9APHY|nr:tRNA splicing endonuclease subunit sen2 [Steccherinum ochraceum]